MERGYATEFTAGDKIGLCEVTEVDQGNGESHYYVFDLNLNLCLTYDGTAWTLPPGAELTPERQADGIRTHYYAYYPWQQDKGMGDKIVTGLGSATQKPTGTPWTPREFFAPLIRDWAPASDQSTYAAYTASDLMVARGTVTKRTDGADGSELRFEMEHQMALAVIQVPTTKYTYTETVSGIETEKSYRLYTGMNAWDWWKENSYTMRRLMNPNRSERYTFTSIYYNSLPEMRQFGVQLVSDAIRPGTYLLYTIDGGKAEAKKRPLKEGDFYMRDGSVLPREAANGGVLPAEVQADCLGVVFWVGENEGRHWTQTAYLKGDYLLMRDHPECTRGMAVALHDAFQGAAWATGEGAGEYLYGWGKGFSGFTPAEQADWEAIDASGAGYGYCRSRLMKLYGAHYPATTFPAYNQIDTYADAHPAPDGSSGWFFPGQRELAMMCYGMTGNFSEKPTTRRNLLNGLFPKAGGEAFDGRYWSNFEDGTNAWTIDFAGSTAYGNKSKSDTHKVRAVIAF
ncbi:fimbrillin family protein [Bacteroides cellulosilyticus]|uniref:fimbrillin family protein n=1 Tax=Bacteroides cellulosilyticus TaxID=246787 RepID=UPI003561D29D